MIITHNDVYVLEISDFQFRLRDRKTNFILIKKNFFFFCPLYVTQSYFVNTNGSPNHKNNAND